MYHVPRAHANKVEVFPPNLSAKIWSIPFDKSWGIIALTYLRPWPGSRTPTWNPPRWGCCSRRSTCSGTPASSWSCSCCPRSHHSRTAGRSRYCCRRSNAQGNPDKDPQSAGRRAMVNPTAFFSVLAIEGLRTWGSWQTSACRNSLGQDLWQSSSESNRFRLPSQPP